MKKTLYILLFGILFLPSTYSQLYVAAPSGLSLREAPNKESKKLDLIPFGTKISTFTSSEATDEIDGYYGTWIKIEYNGKKGYIFDGYTLPFPVPTKTYKEPMEYLSDIYGQPILFDSVSTSVKVDGQWGYYLYTAYYKNGVIFTFAPDYEQYEYSIINLDLSIEKTYLFACLLDRAFECVYKNINGEVEINISCPKSSAKYDAYSLSMDRYRRFEITTEQYYMKIFFLHLKTAIVWGGGV